MKLLGLDYTIQYKRGVENEVTNTYQEENREKILETLKQSRLLGGNINAVMAMAVPTRLLEGGKILI